MQRRIRAALLQENNYGTRYPAPSVKAVDVTALNGGLNLWELDYKLQPNQSPDLLNMYWKDGSLGSRRGQEYIYNSTTASTNYGSGYACYDKPWHGYMIVHKGTTLYKIDPATGAHTQIYAGSLQAGAGGSFFVFGDKLYYMSGHEYLVINSSCVATMVDPYVPLTVVNRKPDGTGGSQNEDENRLSPKKRIRFTTDGTATTYTLPTGYTPMDELGVTAELSSPSVVSYKEKQTYANQGAFPTTGFANVWYYSTADAKYFLWNGAIYAETTSPADNVTFTVNRTTGVLTFHTAPAAAMTQSPSNLEVTISKADADTQNSILKCSCAAVYGGDKQLAVVCGGTPGQPNAYFWSGSTDSGLDPTYFPFDYYNYAGASAEEYIIGFGKQQSMLVIFKERSIGKSYFQTETISDVDYLKLPYTPVNDSIGCDLEGSIRLVQNNLVFANTYGGVYVLLDSTAYGENTVKRISRNINGEIDGSRGLLHDLSLVSATGVTSFDDQHRYYITANSHVYLWDYTISSYAKNEENISWFYFDNITPIDWFNTNTDNYYITANGSIVKFVDDFNDFGAAITRRYKFATLNFGTYEVLKDVLKVVIAVRSDTNTAMSIRYKTDYEDREDLTPIEIIAWSFVPRNLTFRSLIPKQFSGVSIVIRKPRCFHVRHFSMTISNSVANTDMSVVQAQVFYRYNREDR